MCMFFSSHSLHCLHLQIVFFAESLGRSPCLQDFLHFSLAVYTHLSGTVRNMAKSLRIRAVPWGHTSACETDGLTFSHYTFLHFTLDFTSCTHFFALPLLFHFGLHFLHLLVQRSSP